jgi:S-adenosylmethionine decarboxylase
MNVARLGMHVIIDLKTIRTDLLIDQDKFQKEFCEICMSIGATVLNKDFRSFGEGYGYTGVIVLAESHASVHTWPEYGMACLDIFTCGDVNPVDAIPAIVNYFQATEHSVKVLERPIL